MPAPAEVVLPNDREVRVTRLLKAPRQLVWDAHTQSDLLPKWMGFEGWDMPVRDMDVRVGGQYRWQWRNQESGKGFGFFGTFSDVNAPTTLAYDQFYDPGDIGGDMPVGDPCLVSVGLSEQDGVTTLVCSMTFVSKEARDAALSTGMTDGMEFSYTRLDDLFAKTAP